MPKKTLMLSEVAYQELKERIAKLPSGSYLSARQYAKDLGMSYTPIREAFLHLQKDGILRQVPNVGFFVASIDLADLIQVFQVRECIEVFALQKVFQKLRQEHIDKMHKHCKELRTAKEKGDSYHYMAADAAFHKIPLELLGNSCLLTVYDNVRSQYTLCTAQLVKTLDDEVAAEHEGIIASIENRDMEQALEMLRTHIVNMKQRLLESYVNRNE